MLLVVLNAASPYLGLKTMYSIAMYTNLRTEPGLWNHLLVPESFRVFDLQDGLVQLVSSDDPERVEGIEEFDDAQVLPAARQFDGVPRVASPVADDPVLGGSLSAAERVLAGFRAIPLDDTCRALTGAEVCGESADRGRRPRHHRRRGPG